jgi:integrase
MKNRERGILVPADNENFLYISFRTTNLEQENEENIVSRIICTLKYRDDNNQMIPIRGIERAFNLTHTDKADCENYVKKNTQKILRILLGKVQEKDPKLHDILSAKSKSTGPTFQEFFGEHFETISKLFLWKTSTTNGYRRTIKNQLIPVLRSCPMSELTAADYLDAIKVLENSYLEKQRKAYSVSRRDHFASNLYSIAEYARILQVCDTNPLSQVTKENDRLNPMKILRREQHLRKSLTIYKTFNAVELLAGYLTSEGAALGTCLQLMAGLRPAEACGLNFRDVVSFKELLERCYIRVYTQVRPVADDLEGKYTVELKTENGYRFIPVVAELQAFIDAKRDHLRNLGYTEEQISVMPLVHTNPPDTLNVKNPKTNPINYRCTPNKLSKFSKRILTEAIKSHSAPDVPYTENNTLDDGEVLEGSVYNPDPIEYDPESYELRRNFATVMFGVCSMTSVEVQYLMGHKLEFDMYNRAYDFANEDKLLELLSKMDHTIFAVSPSPTKNPILNKLSKSDRRLESEDIHIKNGDSIELKLSDEITRKLSISPASQNGKVRVRIYLQAIEPDDTINIIVNSDGIVSGDINLLPVEKPEAKKTTNVLSKYYGTVFGHPYTDIIKADAVSTSDDIYLDEELNQALRVKRDLNQRRDSELYVKQDEKYWGSYHKSHAEDNEEDGSNE